jgi:hypothetical protein
LSNRPDHGQLALPSPFQSPTVRLSSTISYFVSSDARQILRKKGPRNTGELRSSCAPGAGYVRADSESLHKNIRKAKQ